LKVSPCIRRIILNNIFLGIVISFVFYFISHHPEAQRKLREELRSAPETFKYTAGEEHPMPCAKTLDSLPFLNAVLKESIRLRGNVPTSNPRLTHAGITSLGSYHDIPVGTRVSAFAWCLHRNEEIYPDAEKWIPQRWLNAEGGRLDAGEQERWFWAFGTGSRRCLGQNLAFESKRLDLCYEIFFC
jgi:cytochrome P450